MTRNIHTNLSDLTSISNEKIKEEYAKYDEVTRVTHLGGIYFWGILGLIGVLIGLYLIKQALYSQYSGIILSIGIYGIFMAGKRIGYKEGFFDWYEAGWYGGAKNAVKVLKGFSKKDMEAIEEMESYRESGE